MIEMLKQWAEDVSKAYDVLAFGHTERALELLANTRTSLRQSIKELESQELVPDDIAAILALRDMLDMQPVPPQRTEQEPLNQLTALKEMLQQQVDRLIASNPQRTWVGLTDDEIWEAYMESPVELDCSTDELYALSRTVEAKLKEKNT